MRAGIGPEDVADVAVAVQPDGARLARARVALLHPLQRLRCDCGPRVAQVGRNEAAREEEGARLVPETLRRQSLARDERPRRADRMDAADEATDPFEYSRVFQLRGAAAAARIDRDAKNVVCPCFYAVDRRHYGNLALGELAREGVLLVDLRIAPAPGAVELRDDHRAVLEPDLVDPVLDAVEAEQPPAGREAADCER